jgi:hypothetical protein
VHIQIVGNLRLDPVQEPAELRGPVPTMPRTLSTNSGSVESLNVSVRWGARAKALHMRLMVDWESPVASAIERVEYGCRRRGPSDHVQ